MRTIIISITSCLIMCGQAFAAKTDKPNIIYIMADDHGRQSTSCYSGDNSLIQTPNIDRLAREGMRFTQAFATNSICSPSRAVLLTGKYNHLCGVEKLDGVFDGSQKTFPKLLQAEGYQTALVGKWHLGSQPTGFDFYSVMVDHGSYYDCPLNETGSPWGERGEKGAVEHKGYLTDVITDVSIDWLERRDPNKPFCLMIHHKAPHSPHEPALRHKDLFQATTFPEPFSLLDDYRGRAPELVADMLVWSRLDQNNYREYRDLRKQFTGDRARDTRIMYQAFMKGYLRLIATLDENVGRVLDYLDKTGLAKNTIVIYTSDNGFFNGEHGFYNKMWMYEDGFSLPLIVRMPGIAKGTTNNELVSMIDLAPTLLDLAGAPIPGDIQGCSMKHLLRGERAPWRDALYYHYYGVEGVEATRKSNWIASHEILGVRTQNYKLVYYPTWKDGPFWEYFDLTKDPLEISNLYYDAEFKRDTVEAKRKLQALLSQYRDPVTLGE